MAVNPSRVLLVEADGVPWGTRKDPVVLIRDYDGYLNLVNPDVLQAELQASGLSALGVIIDADENASDRWSSLRSAAIRLIPDLPQAIPETGLIHSTDKGIRSVTFRKDVAGWRHLGRLPKE
jgi:hypothetical protein